MLEADQFFNRLSGFTVFNAANGGWTKTFERGPSHEGETPRFKCGLWEVRRDIGDSGKWLLVHLHEVQGVYERKGIQHVFKPEQGNSTTYYITPHKAEAPEPERDDQKYQPGQDVRDSRDARNYEPKYQHGQDVRDRQDARDPEYRNGQDVRGRHDARDNGRQNGQDVRDWDDARDNQPKYQNGQDTRGRRQNGQDVRDWDDARDNQPKYQNGQDVRGRHDASNNGRQNGQDVRDWDDARDNQPKYQNGQDTRGRWSTGATPRPGDVQEPREQRVSKWQIATVESVDRMRGRVGEVGFLVRQFTLGSLKISKAALFFEKHVFRTLGRASEICKQNIHDMVEDVTRFDWTGNTTRNLNLEVTHNQNGKEVTSYLSFMVTAHPTKSDCLKIAYGWQDRQGHLDASTATERQALKDKMAVACYEMLWGPPQSQINAAKPKNRLGRFMINSGAGKGRDGDLDNRGSEGQEGLGGNQRRGQSEGGSKSYFSFGR